MKRLSIFVGLALGLCLALSLRAADERKMTVVDYFLRLPDKTLEAPPRAWLGNAQVIDKQNGYISITGDGAQPSFQVALFRYRDGRPLLALCSGELEGDDSVTWTFSSSERTARCTKHPEEFFRSATPGVTERMSHGREAGISNCRDKGAPFSFAV